MLTLAPGYRMLTPATQHHTGRPQCTPRHICVRRTTYGVRRTTYYAAPPTTACSAAARLSGPMSISCAAMRAPMANATSSPTSIPRLRNDCSSTASCSYEYDAVPLDCEPGFDRRRYTAWGKRKGAGSAVWAVGEGWAVVVVVLTVLLALEWCGRGPLRCGRCLSRRWGWLVWASWC